MVVFTCQHCGESLKKSVVEKHKFKCRNAPFLTCVDCLKDFRNDEYIHHTSCLTEDQRYGGKDYVAKPTAVKQNEWLKVCEKVLQFNKGLSSQQRKLLQLCSTFINVPRNENKFLNFINNVGQDMRHDVKLAKSVFELINKAYKEEKALRNNKENKTSSNSENEGDKNNKSLPDSVNPVDEMEMNNDKTEIDSSKVKKKGKKEERKNGETEKKQLNNSVESTNCEEEAFNSKKRGKKEKKKLKLLEIENSLQNGKEIKELSKRNDSTYVEVNDSYSGASDKKSNSNPEPVTESGMSHVQSEGLSKKERKRKLKQEKYEAEIKAIESHQVKIEEVDEDSEVVKKKKKKKQQAVEDPVNEVNEKLDSKKTDKKNLNTSISFTGNSCIEVEEPSGKFDWEETIIRLLQGSSDKEMALKRLCKKVVAEYEFQKGLRESHEKIMAKFNKKIHKTVGVRVLKDRAKLILSEDEQSCNLNITEL